MTRLISGKGFDVLSSANICQLLVDKALSEHEIIEVVIETPDFKHWSDNEEKNPVSSVNLSKESFDLANKVDSHFAKHDNEE